MTVTVLQRPMYGVGQAAGLLELPTDTVRRWLDGYERQGVHYAPVVRVEPTGEDIVTWGEFVELGYLREYRRKKVPLQQLRVVIDRLRDAYGVPYPLAHVKPYVAGRALVLQVQEEAGLPEALQMVTIVGDQLLLAEPAQMFYDKVEFAEEIAVALRPMGKKSSVELSPERAFGMPAVVGRNVRTEVLYELWQAGEPVDDIAEGYDLEPVQVEDALRYESRLHAAA